MTACDCCGTRRRVARRAGLWGRARHASPLHLRGPSDVRPQRSRPKKHLARSLVCEWHKAHSLAARMTDPWPRTDHCAGVHRCPPHDSRPCSSFPLSGAGQICWPAASHRCYSRSRSWLAWRTLAVCLAHTASAQKSAGRTILGLPRRVVGCFAAWYPNCTLRSSPSMVHQSPRVFTTGVLPWSMLSEWCSSEWHEVKHRSACSLRIAVLSLLPLVL